MPPEPCVSFGEWMGCDVHKKVEAALEAEAAENSNARRMNQGGETTMMLQLKSGAYTYMYILQCIRLLHDAAARRVFAPAVIHRFSGVGLHPPPPSTVKVNP